MLQIRNKTQITTADSQLKKDNLTGLAKIKNIKYYRQPIKGKNKTLNNSEAWRKRLGTIEDMI